MSSGPPCWRLQTNAIGDLTIVRLVGTQIRLGEEDAIWLRERLFRLAEAGQIRLAVDLSAVVFLTSTTAETFLALHRRLKALGGRLSLCHLTPPVAEIVSVLRLEEVIDVWTTPPDAVLRN
jgi:anti-sigma B factor antagonist